MFLLRLFLYISYKKRIKRGIKEEKAVFYISDNLGEVLVGIMLRDGHI